SRGARINESRTEDWINVNECLDMALELTGLDATATVHKDSAELPPILGAREELVTMFVNLLANAVDAMSDEPAVRIKSEVEGDSVAVTIIDNGVGMDSATRRSAFNMFYSTKKDARGIGLSTVQLLAGRHHGQVLLNSVVGKGTAVRVLLPMNGAPAESA
ncbi:MAG: ATP-binding protein, partial [Gammaproteobacteria bacterium]